MAGCTWREHDGMRYLYADYRGLDDDPALAVMAEAAAIVAAHDGPVRMVSDVTGARLGYRSQSESKRLSRQVWEPRGTRIALIGMTSFQVMAFRGFKRLGQGRAFAAFQTLDEGLVYLAGDEILRP